MGYLIQQGNTTIPLIFFMQDSASARRAGKEGLTITATISKNGGTQAAPAGAITEIGDGYYKIAANATDANALGPIALIATAAGADPCDDVFVVVAYDPFAATNLGLSYLTGDAFARLGAPAGASVSADVAAIKSETAAIQSDTDTLQTDVATLLSRLTSTRAGYLDNLANLTAAPPTAAAITTAVWAAGTRSLTEKTGFSLTTAPPTAAEIKTALEATGGLLELANTRVQLALPAFAPGNNSGVARKSDVASGGGSAGTSLVGLPLRLVIPMADGCECETPQTLVLNRGHIGPVRLDLVDANGVPVSTTSTTLTAKIVSTSYADILDLDAPTEVYGAEGSLTVQIDTDAAELEGKRKVLLEVTRDNGADDVTSGSVELEIKG